MAHDPSVRQHKLVGAQIDVKDFNTGKQHKATIMQVSTYNKDESVGNILSMLHFGRSNAALEKYRKDKNIEKLDVCLISLDV